MKSKMKNSFILQSSKESLNFEKHTLDKKNEMRKQKLFEIHKIKRHSLQTYRYLSNLIPDKEKYMGRKVWGKERSDTLLINFVSTYFRKKDERKVEFSIKKGKGGNSEMKDLKSVTINDYI